MKFKKQSMRFLQLIAASFLLFRLMGCTPAKKQAKVRPNILLLMSDNQLWKHLGCYGDPVVKTPNIDKIAGEGVLFSNAFCGSPSCSPARAAMLSGKEVWTLKQGANLWGSLPADLEVYPESLKRAGYHVGIEGKGWGPGNYEAGGWKENPGGKRYFSFEVFYNEVERGQPWCYWFSSRDPHRPFKENGGERAGIDLKQIAVPPYLPDSKAVRSDIADYYSEIEHFDKEVGSILSLINEMGQLENTIVIICSDNGWQMPGGLANLYDAGTKIPLIISWPGHFKGGRKIADMVSLNDLAPTILELAGEQVPKDMTARSLVPILESDAQGRVEKDRDFVVMGRERHAFVRANGLGYPARAIRTPDYLYIKNYKADRWPAGDPPLFGDVDANMLQYPCPTKMYMLVNRKTLEVEPLFERAFGKRPAEELYDIHKDPYAMHNLAANPAYHRLRDSLSNKLTAYLAKTGDPREGGPPFDFDTAAYYMEADKTPHPDKEAIEKLGLKEVYHYVEAE